MCILVFIVVTAVLAVAGWLLFLFVSGWAGEAGWMIVAVLMVAGPLLALLVHEAGHLLGGVAAGLLPVMMIVGPAGLHWRPGRFWPRLRLNAFIPGGFTLCVPRPDSAVRWRMIIMTAGGPLASLLLFAAGTALYLLEDGNLQNTAGITALVSAGLFLLTAIPYSRGGMRSDGARIRGLTENGTRARSFCASLRLLGAARQGTAPARWPNDLIHEALEAGNGSPERASALHLAYWSALDRGDHEKAGALLSALLSEVRDMSEALSVPASWEAAAYHLFVRGEPAAARSLIGGLRPAVFQDSYLEPLVQAGLAAAEGDPQRAARYMRRARSALPRAHFPAVAQMHARWLDGLDHGSATY